MIVAVVLVVTGNLPSASPSSDQNTPVAMAATNTAQPQTPMPTSMPPAVTPTGLGLRYSNPDAPSWALWLSRLG